MSIIVIKISKCMKLELIDYDKKEYSLRLLFKFNKHNSNWLFLNINPIIAEKLKKILNEIIPKPIKKSEILNVF